MFQYKIIKDYFDNLIYIMSLDSVIDTAKKYCNTISKTNDFQSLPFEKRNC